MPINTQIYHNPPAVNQDIELKKIQTKKKLNEIVKGSHEVLFNATTVFPFNFFPDTINIDREKVTITRRTFFMVKEVTSIAIDDILNVTLNVGPFFGSIKLSKRVYDTVEPYEVNYFWRNDAVHVKYIIQGHIIAAQKKIDCSPLNTKELADALSELGREVSKV